MATPPKRTREESLKSEAPISDADLETLLSPVLDFIGGNDTRLASILSYIIEADFDSLDPKPRYLDEKKTAFDNAVKAYTWYKNRPSFKRQKRDDAADDDL
jgi:hypothetical protein